MKVHHRARFRFPVNGPVKTAFRRGFASSFYNRPFHVHHQKIGRREKSQRRTMGGADEPPRAQTHADVAAPADNQPFLMSRPAHPDDVFTVFLHEVRIHKGTRFQFAVDGLQFEVSCFRLQVTSDKLQVTRCRMQDE